MCAAQAWAQVEGVAGLGEDITEDEEAEAFNHM
jgi:hypothetical protein